MDAKQRLPTYAETKQEAREGSDPSSCWMEHRSVLSLGGRRAEEVRFYWVERRVRLVAGLNTAVALDWHSDLGLPSSRRSS